jgi:hypothetical protein
MTSSSIFPDPPLGDDRLLTTKEAAKLLRVSTAFLERDRWAGARNGQGALIPYIKVGARAVRYRLSDLRHHVQANRRTSTSA